MTKGRAGLLSRVRNLTPYEFEEFVAALWELQGWSAEVTPQSGDEGVDVLAERELPFDLKVRIQAKRYNADNKVGGPEMRKYVLHDGLDADFSAVVTTGSFTSQAVKWADKSDIKTVDGTKLIKVIRWLNAEQLLNEFLEADDVTEVNVHEHATEAPFADASGVDIDEVEDPATVIEGIGANRADQLAEAGIHTVADLAVADIEEVTGRTNLPEKSLNRWINHAIYLEEKPTTVIEGIGSKRAEQLAEVGICTVGDLATADSRNVSPVTDLGEEFLDDKIDHAAKRPLRSTDYLKGVGPARADELAKAGVRNIADLAAADPEAVAERTSLTESHLEVLIDRA